MKPITTNPNNKRFFSDDFLEGFKYGAQRQYEADKAECPHWIPVTERLPEESGAYLVTIAYVWDGKRETMQVVAAFYNGQWNAFPGDEIIAWMPLPAPYSEVK